MGYRMDVNQLLNFDVFPKVFAAGKKSELHIRPLGGRICFEPGQTYRLVVCGLDGANPKDWPVSADFTEQQVTADETGCLTFCHTFTQEQEYYLRFFDLNGNFKNQFPVYCVADDLVGRYPFMGDTHLHSTCSDGSQRPEVVTAQYRSYGYDFLAITDHYRYYPSLENMAFYQDVPTEICLCPGEEVHHLNASGQHNDIHIINFGGEYSINALYPGIAVNERGTDPKYRSLHGTCPPSMTQEEFDALMEEQSARTDVPEGIDPYPAVNTRWIFDEIRRAGGLGIFAHPNWINNTFHVPEKFSDYLVENKVFDAFEVLGGEMYYEQNGFQTQRYYEDRARGYRYPIVGATDSHNCYPDNAGYRVGNTMVFAEKNERKTLIAAIKDFYSVAVDNMSREPRYVGETRLVRYASFLNQYYFPLHDALCAEEGRMMKQYATGTAEEKEEALTLLRAMYGRVQKQRKKYFAF